MFNETIYYILDYERDINDPNLIKVISINIRPVSMKPEFAYRWP